MAHDLAFIGGKHAMFVIGKREDAWHARPTRISKDSSAVTGDVVKVLRGRPFEVSSWVEHCFQSFRKRR